MLICKKDKAINIYKVNLFEKFGAASIRFYFSSIEYDDMNFENPKERNESFDEIILKYGEKKVIEV